MAGALLLSINSSFSASGIEKYFRNVYDIQINQCETDSSMKLDFKRSATRLYGMIYMTFVSTAGGVFHTSNKGAGCSCLFTATGVARGV